LAVSRLVSMLEAQCWKLENNDLYDTAFIRDLASSIQDRFFILSNLKS